MAQPQFSGSGQESGPLKVSWLNKVLIKQRRQEDALDDKRVTPVDPEVGRNKTIGYESVDLKPTNAKNMDDYLAKKEQLVDVKSNRIWDALQETRAAGLNTITQKIDATADTARATFVDESTTIDEKYPSTATESVDDIRSVIKMGDSNKNLFSDPQSGSIMKILAADKGFHARIKEGAKSGHVYSVMHVPGSTGFTFVDRFVGTDGQSHARFQHFVIVPEKTEPVTPVSAKTEVTKTVEAISENDPLADMDEIQMLVDKFNSDFQK